MAAQEGAKIRMEGNPQQGPPGDSRQNSDGSSPTEVLETIMNLVIELQVFKADNEKTKERSTGTTRNKRSHAVQYSAKKIQKDDNNDEEVTKRQFL